MIVGISVAEADGAKGYADTRCCDRNPSAWISLNRFREHRLDARPRRHRTREFRQRVTDQTQWQHQECEEKNHAGKLSNSHVAGLHTNGSDDHQCDARERGDQIEQRLEPATHLDRRNSRRQDIACEIGQTLCLAVLSSVRLDQLDALEALVDAGGELSESFLRFGEIHGDRAFVDDVGPNQDREHDNGQQAEWDIDEEQPDRRNEDHHDRARRERDRCNDTDGCFGVNTGARNEIAVGMATVPPERLGDQLVEHLVGVGLGDAPHAHRGKRSAEHHANSTHQPDADDHRETSDHRSCCNVALFKSNDDHVVNHPANREA